MGSTIGLSTRATSRAFVYRETVSRPAHVATVTIFWFVLIAMVVGRAVVALYGTTCYSHDGFLVIDGAWRMLNGQRPHADFNSMIGPAAYLPTVIGFKLASNTVAGFGYGQALVGLVLGIWAYSLGGRLNDILRVSYALCVTAIAIAPVQLGLSPFALSPGMTYNRYSYALMGVLLLECLGAGFESELVGGLSSGAVIAVLAFTKVTSLIVGVLLLLALIPQRVQTYRRWLGLAAGAALVGLPFLWYVYFDIAATIRDLAITAHAKHVRFTELYLLNSILRDAGIGLVLTFGAFKCLMDSGKPRVAKQLLLAGVCVITAGLLVIFGNYQQSELPLIPLFLLLATQTVLANHPASSNTFGGTVSVVIGGAAVFTGITICSALVSLGTAGWIMMHSAKAAPHFDSPALRQFVPVKIDRGYTIFVNDGFTLLQEYRKPGERVMSLDFTNPFSFGLWIPPAPGGSTNLQYQGSFDAEHKVSPEKLFGAADLVMMPKYFSDESLQDKVPEIYGPFLESHFQLVADSLYWKLYRRQEND